MKKTLLSAAALACLTGFVAVQAQQSPGQPAATAPKTAALPTKIGLVDVARVFRESNEFNDMRARLTQDFEKSRAEAAVIAQKAKKGQEEIALLKKGSPEYLKVEAELAKLSSEFETLQKLTQANSLRRDAEIHEQIYRQTTEVIGLYAKHFNYTLVLRFNSDPLDGDNPQKLANGLTKMVVYHQPQDDITEAVIEYMNRRYGKPQVASPTAGTQPATGPARTTQNVKDGATGPR